MIRRVEKGDVLGWTTSITPLRKSTPGAAIKIIPTPNPKKRIGHQGLIMGGGSYVLCDVNILTYGYRGIVVNVKRSDVGVES